MPKLSFTDETKQKLPTASSSTKYPPFKLEALGDRARIFIWDNEEPIGEYRHTLKHPAIVDGAPKMTTDKDGKRVFDLNGKDTFGGQFRCLGDPDVLDEKKVDPENCPACAKAVENSTWFSQPQLRIAVRVFRYYTEPKSFELSEGRFGGTAWVWNFTEKVMTELFGFQKQWKRKGGLAAHDLDVALDDGPVFMQKLKLSVDPEDAAWMTEGDADDNYALIKDTIQKLGVDLHQAAAPLKERRWVDKDIADTESAWAAAEAYLNGKQDADTGRGLTDRDLSGILDKPARKQRQYDDAEEPEERPARRRNTEADDDAAPARKRRGADEEDEAPRPAAKKAAPAPAPAPVEEDGDDEFSGDFADLFSATDAA